MADGRDLIEQIVVILGKLPGQMEGVAGSYSDDQREELDEILASANKWVGMCRRKQWLRGMEGTKMAQGCLDAAQRMQASLADPATAIDEAASLASQSETLARLVATKSTVMT